MIELFVSTFITFFVVIDPPGCAPIFAGLTAGTSVAHRRAMAVRAVFVAAVILFGFALFGEGLLRALGISLNAFKIAGGIMLFLIALEMVFEKRTERREDRAEKIKAEEPTDISIFPMAMPMIAGPGSIASTMLLMSQNNGLERTAVVLAAMAAILLLTLLALLAAGPLMRVVGAKIEAVVSRLLGVLLGALAVQFVIDGISAALVAGRAVTGH
ncbi:NAAT family transporter [Sphingomonas sp. R-74633]|uniref:MarC family protein n=1 Tax=Sphingomonas sp. R-74633 TaxID=2751188 RepID=UPI0015D3EADC|nr:MarC family protein [Sphingomonas sp. R-74633]NYT42542.1 NAAT family transporter [Sphingomonas sp. R-74633]